MYAVNADVNRMLDVARETYKENVDDIYELKTQLSQEHGIPLALEYQERGGGFWFTVVKDHFEGELPRGFLNVTTKGTKWCFTEMDLVRYTISPRALDLTDNLQKKKNARMKDALEEALLLSDTCEPRFWRQCYTNDFFIG